MTQDYLKKYITEAFKETKEATGAASAGNGISAPAFSMWSEDEEAKSEYKRLEKEEGEFKEATSSASVGPYDANSFENIKMKGNTTKGKGRSWKQTQVKGGSFVDIDPKCKTFPYCNQGNTGAVRYRKPKTKKRNSPLSEAIENVSLKTGLSVEEIKNIIVSKFNGNL
jgi:hypothetical protein